MNILWYLNNCSKLLVHVYKQLHLFIVKLQHFFNIEPCTFKWSTNKIVSRTVYRKFSIRLSLQVSRTTFHFQLVVVETLEQLSTMFAYFSASTFLCRSEGYWYPFTFVCVLHFTNIYVQLGLIYSTHGFEFVYLFYTNIEESSSTSYFELLIEI